MEKTKKIVQSENKEKKSKTKTQKVPKLKKEPLTLLGCNQGKVQPDNNYFSW